MADLRALVESLGGADVSTILNSGNVVFRLTRAFRGDPAERIETGVRDRLGVSSRVVVLSAAELAAVVAENPLLHLADEPSRLLVVIPIRPADIARAAPLASQDWTPDALGLGTRAVYVRCAEGVLASRAAEAVARAFGDGATSRNWATILALSARAG